MVEVGHDNLEALVDPLDNVPLGNDTVFVGHVGGASGAGVLGLHNRSLHSVGAGDQHHGDASGAGLACAHRRDEPVRIHPACDPLLGAVDNKVLTGFIKHGGGAESGHVGASEGLSDRQDDRLVSLDDGGHHLLLHPVGAILEQHRQPDGNRAIQAILVAGAHGTASLLLNHQLVEVGELFRLHDSAAEARGNLQVFARALDHGNEAQVAHALSHLLAGWRRLHLALQSLLAGLAAEELASGQTQLHVRLVEVGRLEALHVAGFCEGHLADFCDALHHLLGRRAGICKATLFEARVLVQNLNAMKSKEVLRRILAGIFQKDVGATGMNSSELGDIVHVAVHNDPSIISLVMLRHFLARDAGGHTEETVRLSGWGV
mmetsp:Transcript_149065/g.211822  ORF Transcript_149065/g.211822 Transcript_149065/m.211822 type:complete len:375 (+) Transcript_149065:718-1842(+)